MIRLIFYVFLALLIAIAASWIAANPGEMILNWQGWELRTPFAVIISLFILYTVFLGLFFKFIASFKNINFFKSPARLAQRRKEGLKELNLGWSALTLEDRAAALKHGRRAKNLLANESGPLFLLAKAETPSGRMQYLKQLEKHSETSAWVKKSHFKTLMAENNSSGALLTLHEILKDYPHSRWAQRKMFDLQARLGKWNNARTSLKAAAKSEAITVSENKHFQAVLNYNQAVERHAAADKEQALELALSAVKLDPSFIPAALFAVRSLNASDKISKAKKILAQSWNVAPHPEMAILFKETMPTETAEERFRRAVKMTLDNKSHIESAHLIADTAMQSQHWREAKSALSALVQKGAATTKTYHLLAQLEQQQANDQVAAEGYMKKAASAAVNAHWSCKECGTDQQYYLPHCPSCQNFDTVCWASKSSLSD